MLGPQTGGRGVEKPVDAHVGLGRSAAVFGFSLAAIAIPMTCCAVVVLLLGAGAGLAMSTALSGPLGVVAGYAILALVVVLPGWSFLRSRTKAGPG